MLGLVLLTSTLALACPQNLANELQTPASAKQLVTVEAKVGRCWVAVAGPYTARLGKNGLSANRREGDGTTPTGTYRFGRTMYGNEANPGVRFRYRRLRCGDWWDEDPASPTYNSFQHVRCGTRPPFGGLGSGIFLHAQTGGPTIGCISLRKPELRAVLRWLRPVDAPVIAIGTRTQLRG